MQWPRWFQHRFPPDDGQFHWLSTRRSPLMRSLMFYVWEYPLTLPGKLLCGAFGAALLIGSVSVETPVYRLAMFILVLLLVASAVGSVFRLARVTVQVQLPERAVRGRPFHVVCTARHDGWRWPFRWLRWPIYDFTLALFNLPPGWKGEPNRDMAPRLDAGESAAQTLQLTPFRRGHQVLPPVRGFSTFPFNLGRNELGRTDALPLIVLPAFHPLTELQLSVGTRHQPGGVALTSNLGESPEYIGNRDYQPGDSLRRIDFRSWARLAKPVVREYQEEYYCRVALVLDTYVPPGRAAARRGQEEFEGAVSLAAAVADVLARGEYLLDLFAAGPQLHIFRAGRATAHFENILDLLAGVDVSRDNPFHRVTPALVDELTNISAVIFVLLDWDADREQLVRSAEEAGCAVKVTLVRDRPPTKPYTRAVLQVTPEQIAKGQVETV